MIENFNMTYHEDSVILQNIINNLPQILPGASVNESDAGYIVDIKKTDIQAVNQAECDEPRIADVLKEHIDNTKPFGDSVFFNPDFSRKLCAVILIEEYYANKKGGVPESFVENNVTYQNKFDDLLKRLQILGVNTDGYNVSNALDKSDELIRQLNELNCMPWLYEPSKHKHTSAPLSRDFILKKVLSESRRDPCSIYHFTGKGDKPPYPFWRSFDKMSKNSSFPQGPLFAGSLIAQIQNRFVNGSHVNLEHMANSFINSTLNQTTSNIPTGDIPKFWVKETTIDSIKAAEDNKSCEIKFSGKISQKQGSLNSEEQDGGDFELTLNLQKGKIPEVTLLNVNIDVPNKATFDKVSEQINSHMSKTPPTNTTAEFYKKISITGDFKKDPKFHWMPPKKWVWTVKASQPHQPSILKRLSATFHGLKDRLSNFFSQRHNQNNAEMVLNDLDAAPQYKPSNNSVVEEILNDIENASEYVSSSVNGENGNQALGLLSKEKTANGRAEEKLGPVVYDAPIINNTYETTKDDPTKIITPAVNNQRETNNTPLLN